MQGNHRIEWHAEKHLLQEESKKIILKKLR
jgi:hypothetical protein